MITIAKMFFFFLFYTTRCAAARSELEFKLTVFCLLPMFAANRVVSLTFSPFSNWMNKAKFQIMRTNISCSHTASERPAFQSIHVLWMDWFCVIPSFLPSFSQPIDWFLQCVISFWCRGGKKCGVDAPTPNTIDGAHLVTFFFFFFFLMVSFHFVLCPAVPPSVDQSRRKKRQVKDSVNYRSRNMNPTITNWQSVQGSVGGGERHFYP